MPEYISREAAIRMRHGCNNDCHKCDFAEEGDSWCQGELFVVDILRLPAADVVEVVRCRDCENWDTEWKPSHAEEGQYFCPILGCVTDADFYCGCGKRKDGGQDDV